MLLVLVLSVLQLHNRHVTVDGECCLLQPCAASPSVLQGVMCTADTTSLCRRPHSELLLCLVTEGGELAEQAP